MLSDWERMSSKSTRSSIPGDGSRERTGVLRGFTLVEVLVVVAVLGVLISILLPSLQQSRQAVRTSVCASNLKQIYTGFIMAQEEFGHNIPEMRYIGRPDLDWMNMLEWVYPCAPLQNGEDTRLSFNVCPQVLADYPRLFFSGSWGYAANWCWSSNPLQTNHGQSWFAIEQPATYPLFMDGQVRQFGSGHSIYSAVPRERLDGPPWGVGVHHGSGQIANVAFAAGQIEQVRTDDIARVGTPERPFAWFQAVDH
jgi:prepilin-type N-terminal cleavage/methylation domain-containing protein